MIDLDSIKHTLGASWHLVEFLFTTIVLKYIVAHWVADRIKSIFKRVFIRTTGDLAWWLHHRNKAMNKGHQHAAKNCDDQLCKFD